jgi:hypothetical protein
MRNIMAAVLVPAYLVILCGGWGILGYVYYRFLRQMTASQSRIRAVMTTFLGFVIGMPLGDSAAMTNDKTTATIILRSVAYAWWILPYALALAIFITEKRRTKGKGTANQAL